MSVKRARQIILLSEFFPPQYGGIENVVGGLAGQFARRVEVVAPPTNNDQADDQQQAYPIYRRSLFSGRGWPHWWWLVSWLRDQHRAGAETVLFGHFSAAVMAAWLLRGTGLKYAVLLHGNDLLTEQRRWPSRWLVRRMIRSADWLSVNSQFVADLAINAGAHQAKIIFGHPWVSSDKVIADAHQPRRILTISRLVPRKNVAGVLRALASLQTEFPDVHYEVVGDGPERTRLERLARQLGLNKRVFFHGSVSDEQKRRLLDQAGVFVMAPLVLDHGADVEGLGIVYLEAARAALPIIASRSGGVPDAVLDQQTGLLIPPGDQAALVNALRQLLRHPDQARQFGRSGQQRVQGEFSLESRVNRLKVRLGQDTNPQPRISVIIPAYQSAQSIGQTLTSVFQQTWKNIEVIVVDDGSTDDLAAAVAPFRSRLQFIQQSNQGAPVARNAGAQLASGEYLIFLDADITLIPTTFADMARCLQTRPDVSFVYSDFYLGWKKFPGREFDSAALRKMNYLHTSSLIRHQHFPGFDPTLKKFQDWDLWLTMVEQGRRGLWIPRTLFRIQPRERGLGYSHWLPALAYRLPWIGQGRGNRTIARYRQAEAIIRAKHHLADLPS